MKLGIFPALVIVLAFFISMIISVSNPSMFAIAKGAGNVDTIYVQPGSYHGGGLNLDSSIGPVSHSGADTLDSPFSFISPNSPVNPVNLPRFDREASYFRVAAPDRNVLRFNEGLGGMLYSSSSLLPSNIQGYQQVSASCEETYRVCVIDAHPEYYIPTSTSCSAGGFGAGCSGASGVTSGGTLSQLIALSPVSYDAKPTYNQISQNEPLQSSQPYQNVVTRHGGIVQVIDTSSNIVIGTITVERTSFGDSELQNEEALFQENLREALIHQAL